MTSASHSNGHDHGTSPLTEGRDPQAIAAAAEAATRHFPAIQRTPITSDAALGRELREQRRSRGWTQKTLAAMVGVTGAQLHRYETGITPVTKNRLLALTQALGVPADSLVTSSHDGRSHRPSVSAHMEAGDDLLALVEVFARITDPKNRSAVIAIARILATTPPAETE